MKSNLQQKQLFITICPSALQTGQWKQHNAFFVGCFVGAGEMNQERTLQKKKEMYLV